MGSGTAVEYVLSTYHFKGVKELDFVPVVSIHLLEGYEWDEFHAWYSPSRRMYFWTSGSGCSCNSIADGIYSLDDLENGRARSDVMAAVNRYFDDRHDSERYATDRADALYETNSFRPSKLAVEK